MHAASNFQSQIPADAYEVEFIVRFWPLAAVRLPAAMSSAWLAKATPSTTWYVRMLVSSGLSRRSAALTLSSARVFVKACEQCEDRRCGRCGRLDEAAQRMKQTALPGTWLHYIANAHTVGHMQCNQRQCFARRQRGSCMQVS